AATSSDLIGMQVADEAMPALPGAQYSMGLRGLCASFHTIVCSRPPLPTTSLFIDSRQVGKTNRLLKMACRKTAGSSDTEAYVFRYVEVDGRPRTPLTAVFNIRSVSKMP